MTEYIYIVKCDGCEDEMFNFFTDARMQCDLVMSKHPIITQVEVKRNDFGECTDSHDLGTVWSWEEMMQDVPAVPAPGCCWPPFCWPAPLAVVPAPSWPPVRPSSMLDCCSLPYSMNFWLIMFIFLSSERELPNSMILIFSLSNLSTKVAKFILIISIFICTL